MTTQEIIDNLPKAVLNWYPFEKDARIFVVKEDTLQFFVDDTKQYDYVIVTTVWEKEKDPVRLFEIARKKLAPSGRLFVLMNNRLGIRYFCGDKDPYTDTVVDCLEDYSNIGLDRANGKLYDKAQMEELLFRAGWEKMQFFSVFSDLQNPAHMYAEDYVPNENLTNRIFPTYNNPDTVFIEEKTLYQSLLRNGMLHQMANAYLVECVIDTALCDVCHVTSSLDRGEEGALFTIIHRSGVVEKRPAYPDGIKRIREITENLQRLKERGIEVVDAKVENGALVMPYIACETGQLYLGHLLHTDLEKFLLEMDRFRALILQSSEIEKADQKDGNGAVLAQGFIDMVPLNSFYQNGKFVFYDQEFCIEHMPANELIYRLISNFYSAEPQAVQIYPREKLLERYDLLRQRERWQNAEWKFLKKLRKETELLEYHKKTRLNKALMLENRKWLNQSAAFIHRYENIFDGLEGKQLILFGTGKYAQKFIELYGHDYPISLLLDNNPEKAGSELYGIKVESPEILQKLPKDNYKIMICIRDFSGVVRQLEEMQVDNFSIYNPNIQVPVKPRMSIQVQEVSREIPQKKPYHIGYVAGAFDMFHIGHLNLIRRAKEQCDYLIAGVMSDERMFELKQKYPVIPCHERMQVVAGCRYVDQVEELPLGRAGIRDAYEMFHFDCMFSGDDHSTNQGWLNAQAYLRTQGSDIVFVSYTKEQSSTEIRKKMQE